MEGLHGDRVTALRQELGEQENDRIGPGEDLISRTGSDLLDGLQLSDPGGSVMDFIDAHPVGSRFPDPDLQRVAVVLEVGQRGVARGDRYLGRFAGRQLECEWLDVNHRIVDGLPAAADDRVPGRITEGLRWDLG